MDSDSLRIETDRLILRPPQAEDFDAYAANMADVEAARFIGGQQARAAAWRQRRSLPSDSTVLARS